MTDYQEVTLPHYVSKLSWIGLHSFKCLSFQRLTVQSNTQDS